MATAVIPAWAAPPHVQIQAAHHAAWETYGVTGSLVHGGAFAAINWFTGCQSAPVTERGEPVSRDLVRAESWTALCGAAEMAAPTARDWRRLGVEPRGLSTRDPGWCYGAWTALSWLLGTRDEPPVPLPDPAGEPLYAVRPDPAAQRAEARREWSRIRQLADRS